MVGMRLCHSRDNSRRKLLVSGTTFNANPSENTQAVTVEHNTPANTQVANKHDLDCSKSAPVRPKHAGKKGHKRQKVFYDDRGFSDSSDLVNRHMHGVNGGRLSA